LHLRPENALLPAIYICGANRLATIDPLDRLALSLLDALALDALRAFDLLDALTFDPLRTLGPLNALTLSTLRTLGPLNALTFRSLRTLRPLEALTLCTLRTLRPLEALTLSTLRTLGPLGTVGLTCLLRTFDRGLAIVISIPCGGGSRQRKCGAARNPEDPVHGSISRNTRYNQRNNMGIGS
jgi:hypothetical protein